MSKGVVAGGGKGGEVGSEKLGGILTRAAQSNITARYNTG